MTQKTYNIRIFLQKYNISIKKLSTEMDQLTPLNFNPYLLVCVPILNFLSDVNRNINIWDWTKSKLFC